MGVDSTTTGEALMSHSSASRPPMACCKCREVDVFDLRTLSMQLLPSPGAPEFVLGGVCLSEAQVCLRGFPFLDDEAALLISQSVSVMSHKVPLLRPPSV